MVPRGKSRRVILNKVDPDFPGETFRVIKEKEECEYGEYLTRRLVLKAWDRLEKGFGVKAKLYTLGNFG